MESKELVTSNQKIHQQKQKFKGLKRARSSDTNDGGGGGDAASSKPSSSSNAEATGEGKRGTSPAPFGGKFKKKKDEKMLHLTHSVWVLLCLFPNAAVPQPIYIKKKNVQSLVS